MNENSEYVQLQYLDKQRYLSDLSLLIGVKHEFQKSEADSESVSESGHRISRTLPGFRTTCGGPFPALSPSAFLTGYSSSP